MYGQKKLSLPANVSSIALIELYPPRIACLLTAKLNCLSLTKGAPQFHSLLDSLGTLPGVLYWIIVLFKG